MIGPRRAAVAAAAAASALCFGGCAAAGLSGSSTCEEFLAAASEDQRSITQQLAGEYDKPSFATPLGLPAVPFACASRPQMTLDEFFEGAAG